MSALGLGTFLNVAVAGGMTGLFLLALAALWWDDRDSPFIWGRWGELPAGAEAVPDLAERAAALGRSERLWPDCELERALGGDEDETGG